MKKVVAILLVSLLVLNTLGLYGILEGLRYKAGREFLQRLDNDDYSQDETITLKVPLSVPYHMDDTDYERVNGEIEYQGEFFRLVKQKLVQDTLYIVCVKDYKTKHIKRALADYVKTFTDQPITHKGQSKAPVSFVKDYIFSSFSICLHTEGWSKSMTTSFVSPLFSDWSGEVSGPPPKI